MKVSRTPTLTVVAIALCGVIAGSSAAVAALPSTPDLAWGTNGKVDAVLRVGNTIYLGGKFTALQDPSSSSTVGVSNLTGIDAGTGLPSGFAPAVNGEVFALAQSPDGSRLYAVGNFTAVNGTTQKRVAVFNTATGAQIAWKPYGWPNRVVRSIAVTSDHVYIGGDFTQVGTAAVSRIAALRPADGTAVAGFKATADDLVRDMVVTSGRLYLAGNFNTINGTSQKKLAAVDPTTGATIPGVYHPTYPVLDLAAGTRLYGAGGGAGGRAFAVDLATGAKLWETKSDGNVQAVAVLNDVPYFGGHFLKFDGTVVAQLVRTDPATGALDTTWLPQVTAGLLGVFAIDAYDPTKLYVGGDFTRVEGLKRTNFAEFTDGAAPADAGVSVSLAGPSSGTVGQDIAYTASIVNAGPDTALNTVVTDVLPVGLDFVSAPGCTYANVNRTVTCNLGAVTTAGASVTITATPTASGTVANTVSVDSSTNDPNPGDNTGTVTTAVASAGGADLGVSTAVAAKVTKGAAFSLVLTVVNHGPLASAATVVDDLPDNAVPNGGATSSQGSCSGGPVKVTCALGPLAAGARATITIPLTAPGAPQTIENTATVTGSVADPVAADDVSTTAITVTSGSASDKTAPKMTGMTMLDPDHDGYVDTVVVNFNEALAACPGNCAKGWVLTGVPSGGSLKSVGVSGRTATLTLGGWTDDPDTSVGLFDVALNNANTIQDAAGNHSSFAATQPADGASPVPVGFRHQHNSGAPCRTLPATLGLAEQCDELTSEWSEPLLPSSIPATTNFTITDPAGVGDQTASIPGFSRGAFDLGSGGYQTLDAVSASWPSSLLMLDSAGDALTVRIFGACQGSGCNALAVVRDVTVTYVSAMTITDAAGNPAAGSVSKTQTMF